MTFARIGTALAISLGVCLVIPAQAQMIGDLVGSWASSDAKGHWGNDGQFISLPSCNDVWSVTEDGTTIAQGRASLRILSDDENWRLADQEVNAKFANIDWEDEISPEEISIEGDDVRSFSLIRASGAGYPARLFRPDPNILVLQLDNRYYSRCPVMPGEAADAQWSPPEPTFESYRRCWFVYNLSTRMASSGRLNDEAQYANDVAMKWSEAADMLGTAVDDIEKNTIAEEVQAMWAGADTQEAQQDLFVNEYFRCNGPPPTELR